MNIPFPVRRAEMTAASASVLGIPKRVSKRVESEGGQRRALRDAKASRDVAANIGANIDPFFFFCVVFRERGSLVIDSIPSIFHFFFFLT